MSALSWCDDLHVVDSGSTDQTQAIAEELGATCLVNEFQGFGTQRNWALANCDLKHPWVLFLDADEQATKEFVDELKEAARSADDNCAGFYCCSKTMLFDRWLKRCDSFPKWQFRVVRRGWSSFENFGHAQREVVHKGTLGYLRAPSLHFAYAKGWSHWFERHNRYSTQEAKLRIERSAKFSELFSKHSAVRLKSLRILLSKLPGWPLLRFTVPFVFRLGFLEGRAGFTYCVNMAFYEYMIKLKMRELQRGPRNS